MWLFLHFLFWDYSTTTAAQEFSIAYLVGYWSNTDAAVFNQLAIWGSASGHVFGIFCMLWQKTVLLTELMLGLRR